MWEGEVTRDFSRGKKKEGEVMTEGDEEQGMTMTMMMRGRGERRKGGQF